MYVYMCMYMYVYVYIYIYKNNFDTFHKHTKGLFLFLLLSSLLLLLILLSVMFLDRDTVKKMGYIFFHSWTVGLGKMNNVLAWVGLFTRNGPAQLTGGPLDVRGLHPQFGGEAGLWRGTPASLHGSHIETYVLVCFVNVHFMFMFIFVQVLA